MTQMSLETVGGRIKFLRYQSRKNSAASFADAVGVSRNTLLRYENGSSSPDSDTLAKICTVCDIDPKWLLFGTEPKMQAERYSKAAEDIIHTVQDEMRRRNDFIDQILRVIDSKVRTDNSILLCQYRDLIRALARYCLNPDGSLDEHKAETLIGEKYRCLA